MEQAKRSRRRHDRELKRLVLQECSAAGASVANVALSHGLNTNLVHKWRREVSRGHAVAASFVPVAMEASSETPLFVDIELQRGALSVRVRWPVAAASSCATWLREILR